MTLQKFMKKYGRKLSVKEMLLTAEKYGLAEAKEFVVQRHPKTKDAILFGSWLGERSDGEPEVLFYKNEKTGEIFSEPECYYQIIIKDLVGRN